MKPILAALILGLAIPAAASSKPQAPVLNDTNGRVKPEFAQNADFIGNASICRVEVSTPSFQPIQCATGSGIVYGVYNSSGAAADAAIILDTKTLPAVTQNGFNTEGERIGPEVLSGGGSATGCTSTAACEAWEPKRPVRFATGLALDRKGASKAFVLYRLDSDDTAFPITK